ncbi:MAG TPA: hypothetical protein VEQ58_23910 [Polyangiaceae bacterium]|nr:hypothetical protein [Polyangiaceae bacterium]
MAARWRRAFCGAAALALLLGACRSPRATPVPAVASEPAPTPQPVVVATPAAPSPKPLLEPTPLVTLTVPGFREAVVSVPLGATEPRVIALALHGNFDRPEWQCEVWRRITRGEVFVLCPRGVPRRDVPAELDRWEWGSLAKTKAELLAALGALRARYPEHVKAGPLVFTGFSLGAILGARLIHDQELNVGAAVLVEGGYQGWTASKARSLQPSLRGLLFACGQTECRNAYRYQLEGLLSRAALPASMVADTKAGHTYDEPVAALVQAEWPRLLQTILDQ